MQALRGALPDERRERLNRLLCRRLDAWLAAFGARRVGAYAAVRGEADLSGLWSRRTRPERAFFFPRVQGPEMTFHAVGDFHQGLLPGAFGIPAPPPSAPAENPRTLDAVLVPGLAFDVFGGRLGWGRGYYDRLFEKGADRPPLVGVAFDFQLERERPLPVAPWDGWMDWVVTDREAVRCLPRVHTP